MTKFSVFADIIYIAMNRLILTAILILCASGLFAAAPLAGGDSSLDARRKVLNTAVKYVDTPYVHGGISGSGVDCSGFVYLSFKEALGVSLPRTTTGLHSWVEKIPSDKAQPGDILFFKTDNTGNISHVAIYLGNGRFIHAASAGSKTGVKYSNLSEAYYSRAFAGAGRAFPEADVDNFILAGIVPEETGSWGGANSGLPQGTPPPSDASNGRLLIGAALAPTWNGFLKGGDFVRGFSSFVHLGAETHSLGRRMVFGVELRPEYDGALGVFRLPVTLSWGPNEKIRIFAGPVFSFGDPSINVDGEERHYSGGTSWLGSIGIMAAPFAFTTDAGDFAPYLEAAWQHYYSDSSGKNANADFSAGFRFSTGIRWLIQVR